MLIEEKLPAAVGAKLPMAAAFLFHAAAAGISQTRADGLLRLLPTSLSNAECFFDKVTDIWKYEFGAPLRLSEALLHGVDWHPVRNLVAVADAVDRLLTEPQRRRYMARLAEPEIHLTVLAEFIPIVRLGPDVGCEFEFKTGEGDRDADWRLTKPGHTPIVIDVKRRVADLIASAEVMLSGERRPNGHAPQPRHDVTALFRSIEKKFPKTDPGVQLQGAWIVTALKQEATELRAAFETLSSRRVHFAVFGGWERGILVLTKRPEDEATILSVFGEEVRRDGWEFVRE